MPPTVMLVVGAKPASLRYIRVTAASIADDAGFDVARIEALRLAIDELCALAFDSTDEDGVAEISFQLADGSVSVAGACQPSVEDPEIDNIARELLGSLGVMFEIARDDDVCRFVLRCDA